MSDGTHTMTLEDFAKLANMPTPPPHPKGVVIVITPALAQALDALIETADDIVVLGAYDPSLLDALDAVKRLHDYEARRLGGERR